MQVRYEVSRAVKTCQGLREGSRGLHKAQ